jgi:coniferyl-aldehyde dehydrogenase
MDRLSAPAQEAATLGSLPLLLERQRAAYTAHPLPSAGQRRANLARLKAALLAHRQQLVSTISADFGSRSPYETLAAEIMSSVNAINHARRHLARWMRPQRRRTGLVYRPAQAAVHYQPLGVVGIMVPWNYPVALAAGPLVSALAAGNRAMIKLSEFTPATNTVIRQLLAQAFAADEVAVVEGGPEVSQAFAQLPFDHLLFTGSTAVGRHVMRAAAANLTPVTLELGGKCPAIIAPGAELVAAAGRICIGKAFNAGQTCIAVDYVLCPRDQVEPLAAALGRRFAAMYPQLRENADYTAIINDRHYQRLIALREEARAGGARVLEINPAGEELEGARKLPLTLLLDTQPQMRIRQEEIFGPLLPIVPYDALDEALAHMRSQPRALALYYFDLDRERQAKLLASTHSGAVCINDTLVQFAQDELPFGGIGASGMGAYHGRDGFLTFSHAKAVMRRGRLNLLRMAYPPYKPWLMRLLEKALLR